METIIRANKTIKVILVILILNIVLKKGHRFHQQKNQISMEVKMEIIKIKIKEVVVVEIDK